MKLTIEHLAPYLPYKLMIYELSDKYQYELLGINYDDLFLESGDTSLINCKPILRPLSDLTKEIEHNGKKFEPMEELMKYSDGSVHMDEYIGHIYDFTGKLNEVDFMQCPYEFIIKLFEWHFDVFGLIENNLAIDINTL